MESKIGQLWQKFYSGTVEKMTGRVNGKCIGLYCDYQENGDYTVLTGCEIEKSAAEKNKDAETTVKIIPKGKYAKFVVRGDVQKAVAESWEQSGILPLNELLQATLKNIRKTATERTEQFSSTLQ